MPTRPPVRNLPGRVPAVKTAPVKSADPTVRNYTAGLVARAQGIGKEQRRDVAIPDLGIAAQNYRPEKDGALTLGQIAQSQENIKNMGNASSSQGKPSLSSETLKGLSAVHAATVAEQEKVKARLEGETAPSHQEPDTSVAPPPPEKKGGLSEAEKQRLAETSDLEFDLMMSRVRSDVMNNVEERKAIEGVLEPLDLAQGLMTGEFTQRVPIKKGVLEITFRTITPFENEQIKRHILQKILDEERYAQIHTDSYGAMQVVASVVMINGQEWPTHLKSAGNGSREFMWETFLKKYERFTHYPAPLIQSLSVHANWFDLRVRALFTNAALKNG